MQMHDHADVIAMLAHFALQTEVQGQFATGSQIAAEIILFHGHCTIAYDHHLLEHVVLHLLFAHARWSDVEVISIMIAYAHIAIATGDPVPAVAFYQGVTYSF
jgi:hypothetical protein